MNTSELEGYTSTKPGEWFTRVQRAIAPITCNVLGKELKIRLDQDMRLEYGRLYIQIYFDGQTPEEGIRGRKWFLSQYMTEDEIIKTVYAAIEACVKHEVMKAFKYTGTIVFNPNVSINALLEISDRTVYRKEE